MAPSEPMNLAQDLLLESFLKICKFLLKNFEEMKGQG